MMVRADRPPQRRTWAVEAKTRELLATFAIIGWAVLLFFVVFGEDGETNVSVGYVVVLAGMTVAAGLLYRRHARRPGHTR